MWEWGRIRKNTLSYIIGRCVRGCDTFTLFTTFILCKHRALPVMTHLQFGSPVESFPQRKRIVVCYVQLWVSNMNTAAQLYCQEPMMALFSLIHFCNAMAKRNSFVINNHPLIIINQNDKFDVHLSTWVFCGYLDSLILVAQNWRCGSAVHNCGLTVCNITPVRDCRWNRYLLPLDGCKESHNSKGKAFKTDY